MIFPKIFITTGFIEEIVSRSNDDNDIQSTNRKQGVVSALSLAYIYATTTYQGLGFLNLYNEMTPDRLIYVTLYYGIDTLAKMHMLQTMEQLQV